MAEEQATVDETPETPDSNKSEFSYIEAFDPKFRTDFEGLTYIGYLETPVEAFGHEFLIKTLTVGDKLQVAQICKEFEGTYGYARAYKAAVLAGALIQVDGEPITVAEQKRSVVRQRFEYIVNTWYDPVIEVLYHKVDQLELRVLEISQELGMADGPQTVAKPQE